VLGYLLVSEIELELEPEFNLEREYYDNRRWFFGILGAVVVLSLRLPRFSGHRTSA
jgi:hypothetical protein